MIHVIYYLFMKKFIFTSILIIIGIALTVSVCLAGPEINDLTKKVASSSGFDASTNDVTLSQNVGIVIRGALGLVGTIFLALTVYAGFLWMTARGDDAQVEKATYIIRRSVVGLIITVAAYSITVFVVSNVFKTGSTNNQVGGSNTQTQSSNDNGFIQFFKGIGSGFANQAKESTNSGQ